MLSSHTHLPVSTLLLCAVLSTGAYAEWDGGIEGGQVLQGDDKGSRLRFNLANNERPFSQKFYADWIRGESSSNTYELGYAPRYYFTDKSYAFGEGSVKTSNSLSIDQQAKLGAGVGYQFIDTATRSFFLEASATRVSTRFDSVNGVDTPKLETTVGTARFGAVQKLSELLKFELDASYSTSDDLVQSNAEAGVSIRVPGGAIKYSQRFRSSTVGDNDAVDVTDSSVSFNYGF